LLHAYISALGIPDVRNHAPKDAPGESGRRNAICAASTLLELSAILRLAIPAEREATRGAAFDSGCVS